MPKQPSPTLASIIAADHDLTVWCSPCRIGVALDPLTLATLKGEGAHIGQLRFRCTKCRGVGRAAVTAKGNMIMGHRQVWP